MQGGVESEGSGESSSGSSDEAPFLKGYRFLAPETSGSRKEKEKNKVKDKKGDSDSRDFNRLFSQALASGQNPNDLMPLMMMSIFHGKPRSEGKGVQEEVRGLGSLLARPPELRAKTRETATCVQWQLCIRCIAGRASIP